MNYLLVAVLGVVLGFFDVLLLALAQKKEMIPIWKSGKIYKQKTLWIVIIGMALISIYFMWLLDEWHYALGVQMFLCAYLLPLSVVDCKYKILPDLFHVVYGIIFVIYKLTCGTWYDLINGMIAVVGVFLMMGVIYLLKKEQLGLGDLKTLCVAAFLVGIPSIVYIFFRSLVVAAIYSIIQLLRHKADLKTEYPLLPFLVIGVLI